MKKSKEKWKPIAGWESYEISDHGNVRRNGSAIRLFAIKGYLAFNVIGVNAGRKSLRVHREVLIAFRPHGSGISRHMDGNPFNNCLSNLEWGNHSQNEADKKRHGRSMRGERHHQAKLTSSDVMEIRSSGLMGTELALKYGVTPSAICLVRKGKRWN